MPFIIATAMTLFGNPTNVDFVTHWNLILDDQVLSKHQTWIVCSKEKKLISDILEVDIENFKCRITRS